MSRHDRLASALRSQQRGIGRRSILCAAVALLGLLSALPAAGQGGPATRYIAFGDSITEGVGDDGNGGYPPRLEQLLTAAGQTVEVINAGLAGETTGEGLSRIDSVLGGGGDVLLLMEGTNDVNARVSAESIRFNLDQIANRAEDVGLIAIHATVIPRLPTANFDGNNRITEQLARETRSLAYDRQRDLIDPFHVFFTFDGGFEQLYVGGEDRLHPLPEGYDVMAQLFADVLLGIDNVPPVTGLVVPVDDAQQVPPSIEVQIDLYDFGSGIDTTETNLFINQQQVSPTVIATADRVQLRYRPPTPFSGVVFVGIESQDLALPPNRLDDDELVQFVTAGTVFLDGDVDRDGRVDGTDLVALAVRFGSERGDGRYRGFADLNGDGEIDGADLAILASNFGRSST